MLLKSDDLKCVLRVASRNEECALSLSASEGGHPSTSGTWFVWSSAVLRPVLALSCGLSSDLGSSEYFSTAALPASVTALRGAQSNPGSSAAGSSLSGNQGTPRF